MGSPRGLGTERSTLEWPGRGLVAGFAFSPGVRRRSARASELPERFSRQPSRSRPGPEGAGALRRRWAFFRSADLTNARTMSCTYDAGAPLERRDEARDGLQPNAAVGAPCSARTRRPPRRGRRRHLSPRLPRVTALSFAPDSWVSNGCRSAGNVTALEAIRPFDVRFPIFASSKCPFPRVRSVPHPCRPCCRCFYVLTSRADQGIHKTQFVRRRQGKEWLMRKDVHRPGSATPRQRPRRKHMACTVCMPSGPMSALCAWCVVESVAETCLRSTRLSRSPQISRAVASALLRIPLLICVITSSWPFWRLNFATHLVHACCSWWLGPLSVSGLQAPPGYRLPRATTELVASRLQDEAAQPVTAKYFRTTHLPPSSANVRERVRTQFTALTFH